MPAARPPPVPPAAPRHAAGYSCAAACAAWLAAVDEFVFAIYRTGFVHSLILHVAAILLLAIIVIRPDLPRPAALALEFATAVAEAEPDVAAVELPALAVEELDVPDDAAPLPEIAAVDLDGTDFDAPELDAVEPAAFAIDDQPAGPDAVALLAEVSLPPRRGGDTGGAVRGDNAGIGGEIGRRLRAAGAGTGDVQISIAWSNVNDIDLHVLVEPLDQRAGNSIINFMNRVGIAGGWLDVDHNVRPTTRTPVENVFWGRGAAPFGRYTVAVHHYRDWGGGNPTEVEVVTLVDGKENRFYVVLRPGEPLKVVTSFRRGPAGGAVGSAGFFPRPSMPLSRPIVRGRGPYVMPMPLK